MDVIDSHAYWQHPHFPRTPVGPGRLDGQKPRHDRARPTAARSHASPSSASPGKPYICTEYNHAAPNTFAAETFPLICAYAALQDWDGVFAFAYSHRATIGTRATSRASSTSISIR